MLIKKNLILILFIIIILIDCSFKNLINLDNQGELSEFSNFLSQKTQKLVEEQDIKEIRANVNEQSIIDPYLSINANNNKFIFQKHNSFKISEDSTTLNVLYAGEKNASNYLKIKLIKSIAGSIFFDNLRIKNQLGYNVSDKILLANNRIFYAVHVQGSHKHPMEVMLKIDQVFNLLRSKIRNLNEAEFNKKKNVLLAKENKFSTDLKLKNHLYFGSLLGINNILSKNDMKNEIEKLTKTDLIIFYNDILNKEMSIQV